MDGLKVKVRDIKFGVQKFLAASLAQDFGVAEAAQAPPVVGDLTAGDPPVPIPNTEVKPRWADCTARESVWESR